MVRLAGQMVGWNRMGSADNKKRYNEAKKKNTKTTAVMRQQSLSLGEFNVTALTL